MNELQYILEKEQEEYDEKNTQEHIKSYSYRQVFPINSNHKKHYEKHSYRPRFFMEGTLILFVCLLIIILFFYYVIF